MHRAGCRNAWPFALLFAARAPEASPAPLPPHAPRLPSVRGHVVAGHRAAPGARRPSVRRGAAEARLAALCTTPRRAGRRRRQGRGSAVMKEADLAGIERWTDLSTLGDPDRILRNFQEFSGLVGAAQHCLGRGDHAMAAVLGDAALGHALARHPGLFACPALEHLLVALGRAALPPAGPPRPRPGAIRHVLHVCSYVRPVGGHSRLIWRWIGADAGRRHSLALTRETHWTIPEPLREAVRGSGGRITIVNSVPGGLLRWARRLHAIARTADAIVLHGNDDVLPLIALAGLAQEIPVILVDHADHLFWLGAGTATLIASMRESGLRLARRRRGVDPSRQALLPTLIEPPVRDLGRTQARRALGIPEDAVVLLSIARAGKYACVNGVSFAEAHLPLLLAYPRAELVVVGPGRPTTWAAAIAAAGGRIRTFAETPDTARFYAAADLYLDSYPHTSITSLLEAGAHGIPLVTLDPYGEQAEVLAADMPGLTGSLVRTGSHADYLRQVGALVADAAARRRLGDATRAKILACHTGTAWRQALEDVYRRALAAPRAVPPHPLQDPPPARPEPETLDLLLPLHGRAVEVTEAIEARLRLMPLWRHMFHMARMARAVGVGRWMASGGPKRLVPLWLVCLLRWRPTSRMRGRTGGSGAGCGRAAGPGPA